MESERSLIEPLIECVPNFSEGRDQARVDRIVSAIAGAPGVQILDRSSDWDHHRSVITFAGRRSVVVEAAVRGAAKAVREIDLRQHHGIHPRLGALDVLPFVPLEEATLEDCAALAHLAGERIYLELGVPVYFYGAAALRPDRVALENVRRGQFEGVREAALLDVSRAPDLGGPGLHSSAGGVIVGARKILIAFNINLKTTNLILAKEIAKRIRASSGGYPKVKALGLPLSSRGLVQVSTNLLDFEQTPLHVVYAEVSRLAGLQGVEVEESEIVGLLPREAMERTFAYYAKLPDFSSRKLIENQIKPLRFSTVEATGRFLPGEKIC